MWICERHKNENEDALENFKNEYQKNHQLLLGLFTAQIQVPAQSPRKKSKVSGATDDLAKAKKSKLSDTGGL